MTIKVCSPLRGWAAPLSEVPDPVFSECMLGDGVAIHPVAGTLHAPFDGVIVTLHSAGHALTIRSDDGAEILVHIGLETVKLAGNGFTPHVAVGDRVSHGDPLIDFDLDQVAQRATSLITPVIVTNGDAFRIVQRTLNQPVGAGEALMTLEPIEVDRQVWTSEDGTRLSRMVSIPMVHGIHARPAARIGACVRAFRAEVTLVLGDRRANARSAVALLSLDAKKDAEVTIEATGDDAAQAIEALAALITGGMGETVEDAPPAAAPPAPDPQARQQNLPTGQLAGVTASPGIAIGHAARMTVAEIEVPRDGENPAREAAALDDAIASVGGQIGRISDDHDTVRSAIMAAHLAFLDDEDLRAAAQRDIDAGRSAGFAWRAAIRAQADVLKATGDRRLAERIDDLLDIERQVLAEITGEAAATPTLPAGTILIARDLLPSQLIGLDVDSVAGICLEQGGPTSHLAILAASMGMPALVAMGEALAGIADDTPLILDADAGRLVVDPDTVTRNDYAVRVARRDRDRAEALAAAQQPCHSADGARIEIFANLASVADAKLAADCGAEGSGLLRTEFLFLDRDHAPDENEQAAQYQAIAQALSDRPIIIRLLDIGGDKPARYVPIAPEENPALGLRGIRVGLDRPDLLETQIRAILRTQPAGQCRIMVPMVASVAELRAVREIVRRIAGELGLAQPPAVGVMIETPAAAATADLLAVEADFLSIGTNDLTQYVLAMDRGNQAVADQVDALHPAVLRMIAATCEGAATRPERQVGVCGGAASDAAAIPILLGLGVTELSVTPRFVPEAKAIVRRLSIDACRAHATHALSLASAAEVRALARTFLSEMAP
ncbi:phosphoenolpyruvate--protein phosphotransferase [Sphingosinithalassobacter portus]|uniref:phosphoenolpyruvate--protein phosphotransferase n=1 Tax=Stakelama portus TaxID=2676234 RepID=UPI000D6E1072|nr:phosphoenolpyruvate--protein phosphotransferase [Sphingosinithalassobacter portus]